MGNQNAYRSFYHGLPAAATEITEKVDKLCLGRHCGPRKNLKWRKISGFPATFIFSRRPGAVGTRRKILFLHNDDIA